MNTPTRILFPPQFKKVYLAGPMRGLPGLNFEAFHSAAQHLRLCGLTVVSPAEKDIQAGYSPTNPRPWIECACEDAKEVLQSDAIVVLPGWEHSRGTRFEIHAALAADNHIPVIDYQTFRFINDPITIMYQAKGKSIQEWSVKQRSVDPDDFNLDCSMRTFDSGATRTAAKDKHDYDGFLSPHALDVFGTYMHKHRFQADGKVRESDNWQKGIPLNEYVKSAWRHFLHFWRLHRGYSATDEKGTPVTMEDTLAALMFNIQGYCHEFVKANLLKKEALNEKNPVGRELEQDF